MPSIPRLFSYHRPRSAVDKVPGNKVSMQKREALPGKAPEQSTWEKTNGQPKTKPQELDAPPRSASEGKVVYVKLFEFQLLHTFCEHLNKVTDDERLDKLVGTIREHDVMTPITICPEKDVGCYECIKWADGWEETA